MVQCLPGKHGVLNLISSTKKDKIPQYNLAKQNVRPTMRRVPIMEIRCSTKVKEAKRNTVRISQYYCCASDLETLIILLYLGMNLAQILVYLV